MPNIYPPHIQILDERYQRESTIKNELALEKAKLEYYTEQLSKTPSDKDLERRVKFHRQEVIRLEMESKIC